MRLRSFGATAQAVALWLLTAGMLSGLIQGCSGVEFAPRQKKAAMLASELGWQTFLLDGGAFHLYGVGPPAGGGSNGPLFVYIEGDGLAFLGARRLSPDPTPDDPLALRLAQRQPGKGTRVYLARPCQYVLPAHGKGCHPAYWSSHRYAPEVVVALDSAITQLMTRYRAREVVVVGYSGGGPLAVLVAARRHDVAGIVTVVGNLDHGTWTRTEHLAPLIGSLDAADVTQQVRSIPQAHLVGGKDRVVPSASAEAYMARLPGVATARLVRIPDFDHECCWVDQWPRIWKSLEQGGTL